MNGAVVLGIPDDLAWSIYIESKDCDTISEMVSLSLRTNFLTT